jgi:c-src tyrosine kinase
MLGKWKKNKVAVKVLKDSSEAEAILMKSLHHENLVNLLGIVRKKDQIYLVTEYMSKGSLVDYLRSRGRLHVTKKDQINFAFDTSSGMEYLEKMHVVHRDLAARNVLIAENAVAKVSDFGLARNEARNEMNPMSESAKLPIKWTAPEALKRNVSRVRVRGDTLTEIVGCRSFPTSRTCGVLEFFCGKFILSVEFLIRE